MYYALLIYQQEGLFEALDDAAQQTIMGQHQQLHEVSKQRGVFAASTKLMPASAATTVNKSGDKVTVTDGPFAETREVLAGFYVFRCDTLDEAIDYAKRIPHIREGKVEIRPISYTDSLELYLES